MVYYSNSLDAVIESVYLAEDLAPELGRCNIVVNPKNLGYISGRIVIINDPSYSWSSIVSLIESGAKVISRVHNGVQGVHYQPYIMRVNQRIQWNGEVVDLRGQELGMQQILDLLAGGDDQKFKYDIDKRELYFPKVYADGGYVDSMGDLTSLGWASQQVGRNILPDCAFTDLDLVKTKKWAFVNVKNAGNRPPDSYT